MPSQAFSSWKASLHSGGATTRSSPFSSDSSSTMPPHGNKNKEKKLAARKPKRTSFTCLECNKTFPSQQAMAGHCSAHTRAGARRMPVRQPILLPAGPVVAAASPSLQLAQCHRNVDAGHCVRPQVHVEVRYVPYSRPISNQMMVRLPYLELHGQSSVSPPTMYPAFYPAPVHNMPAAQLGWGTFVPIYSSPPASSLNGAAPSEMSSTNLPGHHTPADKTLRLGSGSNYQQKSTLPLLEPLMVSGGHQGADRKGKRALVTESGASNRGDDPIKGLDLELHLRR